MKILMINYEYPPLGGGGGIAMMEIAEELGRRHSVHILTSGAPGLDDTSRRPSVDVTVHRVPVARRNARATASIVSMLDFLPSGIRHGNKLLQSMSFDVANTWFAVPSGLTGGWITEKHRVPHVLTVIGGDIYDPSKWYSPHHFAPSGWAVKWALRHADAHIAISADIADRTAKYFGFDKHIEVIPLGIRVPKFEHTTREKLKLDARKRYVTTVGRLVRRKDYPTLVRSIKLLDRDDVELLMIGDGPEQDNLHQLAAELGIANRVRFLGFVSNEVKYQILSVSDLFVLASLHEGFGVVYLEAMFCGLPVIAANRGGQLDILQDSVTGALVTPGDERQISDAMRDLLDDSNRRAQIGQNNAKRAANYEISRIAQRYERILEKAAGARGVRLNQRASLT
jgi:glycosyltransferase involved in cell wall biosynthesis